MPSTRTFMHGLLAALLLAWAMTGSALEELDVGDLSYLDRQFMEQQRNAMTELTERHFGRKFRGSVENDLYLLQRLLDDRLVRDDQTEQLQAMGILLGDLLASELGLHWVVYEDRIGRSRALRYQQSDIYLFPVTMISRRREGGDKTPVADIYQKAVDNITPSLPSLPFQ